MSAPLALTAADRVLVLAPHPDDESLGAGGLILAARAAGAAVRVIVATDGDDNPWPQRKAERRWRIDAAARARWGAQRREEARAALARLGIESADVDFLGWPDQGLTRALHADGEALVDALGQRLRDAAPTWLAAPTWADTHPDHSALRLLLEVARRRTGTAAPVLGYGIHGVAVRADLGLSLDEARLARKRDAVLCHASQTHFGRGRLLRFVHAQERFQLDAPPPSPGAGTWELPLALPAWPWRALPQSLELLGWSEDGGLRARRLPLPPASLAAADYRAEGLPLRWRRRGNAALLRLPALWPDAAAVFFKRVRRGLPWLVFDDRGWSAAQACADAAAAADDARSDAAAPDAATAPHLP